MHKHPFVRAALSLLICGVPAHSQQTPADVLADPAIRLSRPADRALAVRRIAAIQNTRREVARERAAQRGLPIRRVLPNGRVQEIVEFRGERPLYRTTDNTNAAISTGADLLRTSPHVLSGSGVTIGMWDGGSGRSTHQEFGSRMVVMDGSPAIDHATHVGGTMVASGVVASSRGMASSAIVHSYDWNQDLSEMTSRGATAPGDPGRIYLSNHSYGYVSGWNYVNNSTRVWEWYGSGTGSTSSEDEFGRYNTYARDSDSLAYNAPYYLMFRSAGNERIDNPSSGQTVSLFPGGSVVAYDPTLHPAGDGRYRGGFDTIGFDALAKNVITIGSTTDAVTSGVRDTTKAVVSSFTSWGPTDDGRIKPDITANGDGIYSTYGGSNTAYGNMSGTSMSSPNAAGSAALLIQQFGTLFPGKAMRAATLKGLLIHTAEDRGNVGPDYKYGWGLMNVKAGADLIQDHFSFPAKQRLTESNVNTSSTSQTHSFVWDGASPITATLSWTDPAGGALSGTDNRTPRLVNNLHLKIIAPDGSEYYPFVMPFVGTWTQASMDLPAITGVNNTDNLEQVRVATPPVTGTYRAIVTYSGTLVNSSQNYSLLLSGSSVEAAPPAPLSVTAVSPSSGANGIVTAELTGTGLAANTSVRLTRSGQSDIIGTDIQLSGETLRFTLDLGSASVGEWNVVAKNPDGQTSTLTSGFTVIGSIWSENFDGSVEGWTTLATTGSSSWSIVTTRSHSLHTSLFAPAPATKTRTNLTSPSIAIPALANNLQLKFWQHRDLQSSRDAGKLEFSINGGTWFDVESTGSGAAFVSNGYNSTVSSSGNFSSRNEFAGQRAWSGSSNGFVETIVNLTDTLKFAGNNLRMRWSLATDSNTSSYGWHIDTVALLGGGDFLNQAPVVVTAASTSSPETAVNSDTSVHQIIRGVSTGLSVVAADDAGEQHLTYTWAVTGGPDAPTFFSTNGSNLAKNTTLTFEGTGDYLVTVAIRDAEGLTVTSSVNVRVVQEPSGVIVNPAAVTLTVGSSQPFDATVLDQFSAPMAVQPTSYSWSASGGGTISAEGVFLAGSVGGPFSVTATSGAFSNTGGVTVTPAPASVLFGGLTRTYTGSPQPVSVTTSPAGLAVAISYNGSATVPRDSGSYAVEANIIDPNYQGSASGTYVIGQSPATIILSGFEQTYDGTAKSVTTATTPGGVSVAVSYNGSPDLPIQKGTYAVTATISDPNYTGTTSGTLEILPGNALRSWRETHFTAEEIAAGLAEDNADPDHDTLSNLAEYALGQDPKVRSTHPTSTIGTDGLSITFTRPAALPDVVYGAESSGDFTTWAPLTLEIIQTGDIETLRARDPLTTGDPTRRFLRLRFDPK